MELHEKTREELTAIAKELGLKFTKATSDANLKDMIERSAIEKTIRMEEETRQKLMMEYDIKKGLAEVQVAADKIKMPIEIPKDPTLQDVIRLKELVGIKSKEPIPSPETIAIEKSKKVYAIFRNMEQEDLDVAFNKGDKYNFHLWPNKIHVLPAWLITNLRSTAVSPKYEIVYNKVTGNKESKRVGSKPRFVFEVIGDAPPEAPFGVVLDEKILSKLTQTV